MPGGEAEPDPVVYFLSHSIPSITNNPTYRGKAHICFQDFSVVLGRGDIRTIIRPGHYFIISNDHISWVLLIVLPDILSFSFSVTERPRWTHVTKGGPLILFLSHKVTLRMLVYKGDVWGKMHRQAQFLDSKVYNLVKREGYRNKWLKLRVEKL